jgi:hypothetical protein
MHEKFDLDEAIKLSESIDKLRYRSEIIFVSVSGDQKDKNLREHMRIPFLVDH